DIACPGDGAADRVVGAGNLDAIAVVAHAAEALGIGADVIAQHLIAAGCAVEQHTVAVAGDDIERSRRGAADRVAAAVYLDADAIEGQGLATGEIGADVVAQHLIAAGCTVDQHTIFAISGNEVAGSRYGAANRVAGAGNLDAGAVGQDGGAGGIGADVV